MFSDQEQPLISNAEGVEADKVNASKPEKAKEIPILYQGRCCIDEASIWKRFQFDWAGKFMRQAHKTQLHLDMYGESSESDKVQNDLINLERHYKRYKEAGKSNALMKAAIRAFGRLLMWQCFMGTVSAALQFTSPYLIFRLINFIKNGDENPGLSWDAISEGVYLSAALSITQIVSYIINEHMMYYQIIVGIRASVSVCSLIYKKHSHISNATNKDFSQGEIVNFVQVDSERLLWVCFQLSSVTQIPLVFGLAFGLAFYEFGVSFFAGVGVIILAIVINLLIGIWYNKTQKVVMARKDARMGVTTESINNAKMLKLYSWQDNFMHRTFRRRGLEVASLRKRGIIVAIIVGTIYFFPSLLGPATFSVYIGTGNTLDFSVAVGSLVLFQLMKEPMISIPMFFSDLIELIVSMKRIEKFVDLYEVQKNIIERTDYNNVEHSIQISGNFSWGFSSKENEITKKDKKSQEKDSEKSTSREKLIAIHEEQEAAEEKKEDKKSLSKFMTLKEVDLQVKKGEFLCIIGDVGSGKSSLLSSIIGDLIYVPQHEVDKFGGLEKEASKEEFDELKVRLLGDEFEVLDKPIKIAGTMSYVEQSSWIQNKTIKDNILFGLPFDSTKYLNTIKACQLISDLKILPAGDATEIGEKGINLSGGQKARVSLARAVYADTDTILMDDPISALDANVRKKIFKQVFQGLLKDKTRVLVTHAVDFLHLADRIVVLKDGKIQAEGSYTEMKENPHLQEVLAINKRNLEHNRKQQDQARNGENNPRSELGEDDNELLIVDESVRLSKISLPDRVNRSTIENTHSGIKIVGSTTTPEKAYQPVHEIEIGQRDTDSVDSDCNEDDDPDKYETATNQLAKIGFEKAGNSGKLMSNEEDEEVIVSKATYWKLFKGAGGVPVIILINLVLIAFITCQIMGNFLLQEWAYATPEDQQDKYGYYLTLIVAFAFGTFILTFLRISILVCAFLHVAQKMHDKYIKIVFSAPINLFFDVTPVGKILNRFSKDLSVIDEDMCFTVGGIMSTGYQGIGALAVACYTVPWMTIFLAFMIALSIWLFSYSMAAYKDSYRIEAVAWSPLLSYFQETFKGNTVIRAFKKEEDFMIRADYLLNRITLANQIAMGIFGWYSMRSDYIASFMLVAGCVASILLRDQVSPVLLGLMLQYLLNLQWALQWTMHNFGDLSRRMVSVQRLMDLDGIPREREDQPHVANWPTAGKVEFRDIELRYRPTTDLVLKGLNFVVEPGTKVGVVGRTGAGKSTISLALSRIVEISNGQILIDDHDISEIDLHLVRQKITVIAQDPTLFTGTLRQNLDPFKEHSSAAIEALLIRAGLSDVLNKEPESSNETDKDKQKEEVEKDIETIDVTTVVEPSKQDTEYRTRITDKKKGKGIYFKISEGGSNLSAGERQLICICRAILRKNKVVVLDEATANIDVVTEEKIQKLIEEEFKESTVITIAHRLNTIIKSDKVLVLDQGSVQEYDTPQALMKDEQSKFSQLLKELKQKKNQE